MVKFLFGGGWWTAWYVVVWLLSGMFVWIPLYALIRDAVPKPAGPASLGSVAMAMSVGMYFGFLTPINVGIGARLSGQGWILTLILSIALGAAGMVGGYLVMAMVCEKGGYARSAIATGACVVMFLLNLGALAYGRSSAGGTPSTESATSGASASSTAGGGVLDAG